MSALQDLEIKEQLKSNLLPEDRAKLLDGVPTLPKGYRVVSTDGRLAQKGDSLIPGILIVWDDHSKLWTSRFSASLDLDHIFIRDPSGGDSRSGVHYLKREKEPRWVNMPNPQKPPPEGTSLSSSAYGVAERFVDGHMRYHEWSDTERDWLPVDPIPLGYRRSPRNSLRFEAVLIDNYRMTIYWDRQRRAWIDPRTGGPAEPRPRPPSAAVIQEEGHHPDDIAKEGEDTYYLWNANKHKWVRLQDLPSGFHRGEDLTEAYEANGSAFDHWIKWDNDKEAWENFDSGRMETFRGRIQ